MNDSLRELLYRSFDDELSADELAQLKRALAKNESLRAEEQRLQSMRSALSAAAPASFAAGFSQRVARRLAQEQGSAAPLISVMEAVRQMFRYVAAITVPACVALVIWNFQADSKAQSGTDATVWETPLETMLRNGE